MSLVFAVTGQGMLNVHKTSYPAFLNSEKCPAEQHVDLAKKLLSWLRNFFHSGWMVIETGKKYSACH